MLDHANSKTIWFNWFVGFLETLYKNFIKYTLFIYLFITEKNLGLQVSYQNQFLNPWK